MIQDISLKEKQLEERKKLFFEQLEAYREAPCEPCSDEQAMKLLKKFDSDYMHEKPLSLFLPAVSQGVMRLQWEDKNHDQELWELKEMTRNLDPKMLAREFLYGLKNRDFKYTTALAIYYYTQNLQEHSCSNDSCDICSFYVPDKKYHDMRSDFYSVNESIVDFYKGRFNFCIGLRESRLYMQEYLRLQRAETDKSDYDYFMQIMKYIDTLSPFYTPAKLSKELKKNGGMGAYTNDQIRDFIDMMGYLDIFHTDKARGVVHSVASDSLRRQLEITEYIHPNSYCAFPVVYWTKKDGIDFSTVSKLFDGIYE